jgi:hypothetical protein
LKDGIFAEIVGYKIGGFEEEIDICGTCAF